jgi:hypothetical protein
MKKQLIPKPQNPAMGELWYDAKQEIMQFWSGTGWIAISHTEVTEVDWTWHRKGLTLRATSHFHENFTDTYLNTIQDWCTETSCGTRTSFDTWQFKNQSEITAFLLTWG